MSALQAPDAPSDTLDRRARLFLLMGAACVFVPACFRLPPGVCFGDSGDIQTACATMGVAHPPGYAGFAFIGWLLTRMCSFVDPARVVSLACLSCMTGALLLTALMLVRLGVGAAWAAVAIVVLGQHDLVWQNLVLPEVYAPGALLLTASAYLLLRYRCNRRRAFLNASVAMLAFACAQRPSVALLLPGFAAAGWMAVRGQTRDGAGNAVAGGWKRMVGTAVAGLLPVILAGWLTYARIGPSSVYSCVREQETWSSLSPRPTELPQSRLRRTVWVMRAELYQGLMGADLGQMRAKLRWVRSKCQMYGTIPMLVLIVLAGFGTASLWRVRPDAVALAWGVMLGDLAFVLQYRVHDTAADLLPLLLLGTVLVTIGLHACAKAWFLQRASDGGVRDRVGLEFAVLVSILSVSNSATRPAHASWHAHDDVRALDIGSLPHGALLCAPWEFGRAAWYAKLVLTPRPDVEIIATDDERAWVQAFRSSPDRPVFMTHAPPPEQAAEIEFLRHGAVLKAERRVPRADAEHEQALPVDEAGSGGSGSSRDAPSIPEP